MSKSSAGKGTLGGRIAGSLAADVSQSNPLEAGRPQAEPAVRVGYPARSDVLTDDLTALVAWMLRCQPPRATRRRTVVAEVAAIARWGQLAIDRW